MAKGESELKKAPTEPSDDARSDAQSSGDVVAKHLIFLRYDLVVWATVALQALGDSWYLNVYSIPLMLMKVFNRE